MEQIFSALKDVVEHLGYIGVFIATLIESTFVPVPAEFTMIPAGGLVAAGKMNYAIVLTVSTLGVVVGSYINYWVGRTFGREFVVRFGKYILLKASFLDKVEVFFNRHGKFATFSGRLLPGVRHYIAFPAGMAKMPLKPFVLFTALGGGMWMWILLHIGYIAGKEADKGIKGIEDIVLILIILLASLYAVKLKFFK
jgi:membrane protein DedA with SNARE-associated domain